MSGENSIINLGDLSKPANTLIEKISEATGAIFKPWQIKRVAKAEAIAEKIQALSKIEISEFEQRALQRFMHEESRKQRNIESITAQSIPQLNSEAKPEKIEDDWLTNFFDKCRLVSDEEMQSIWSRILAGEANIPGSFSKRTVNFMESLDKQDAQLFTKLCAFNWNIGGVQPLIYDTDSKIYTNNGINFSILKHLDTIGLISFESLTGFVRRGLPQKIIIAYGNDLFNLKFPKENDNEMGIGKVLLTTLGREIANICSPENIDGFDQYIIDELKKIGIEANNVKNQVGTSPATPSDIVKTV